MKILVLTKRQYMGKDLLDDRFGRFRELPLELAKLNHQVAGICLSYRPRTEGMISDDGESPPGGVSWLSFNLGRLLVPGLVRYCREITRFGRQFKPDIIWACSDSFHAIFGLHLALNTRTACVIDLYDNFEAYGASRIPGVMPLFRKALVRADGVTCFSHRLHDHIVHTYRRASPTSVIENGVRRDVFHPQDRISCRKQLGLPLKASIVGTAGALHRSRGIAALFRSFELLAAQNQNLHLAVAGPRGKGIKLPRGARVHDLGILPWDRVALLINSLDVAVICYRNSELGRYSFPQKAYEIVACRIPLVAARVGSMQNLLADHPECLFEPEDPESLAKAIRHQLAAPMVPNIDAPTWAEQAKRLENFFTHILDRAKNQGTTPHIF